MTYTGRLFEEELLGPCRGTCYDYVPFRKAMAMVKHCQPGDPSDPESQAMNDLHALLCEELGIADYSEVKLYSAVGSPLDYWHGVDAFVEYRNAVVTIDLTLNARKDVHKADIILHENDVYGENGEVNRLGLQEVARQITHLLKPQAKTGRVLVAV